MIVVRRLRLSAGKLFFRTEYVIFGGYAEMTEAFYSLFLRSGEAHVATGRCDFMGDSLFTSRIGGMSSKGLSDTKTVQKINTPGEGWARTLSSVVASVPSSRPLLLETLRPTLFHR